MSKPINALTSSARILVVDDEPDLRTLYELTLLREGYQVETAQDLQQAQELLRNQAFDVLITDMRLPDGLGMSLITDLKAQQRGERCVVITAYGSTENAVQALKSGAFDYLTKPVDLKQFRTVIASAVRTVPAQTSANPKTSGARAVSTMPDAMGSKALMRLVGQSASMCAVKDRILKVASSMAPVMITGESGTGKELVAYAIHANSHRASGPWVAVNCSAIPENLLEAEFFGARKGAYTGAHQDRDGFFQAARGGTLFLDEIGDLPLAMQSKLLRAIQERRIRPLGSSQEETVDVRILSATHKNLTQEVQAGLFRQDLFYRLNVIDVAIAPLRERRADLAALCTALLKRIAEESGMPPLPMPSSMLDQLAELPMPGNVRELENLLHRAVALYDGQELQLDASKPQEKPGQARATETPESAATAFMPDDLQRYLDEKERRILIQALEKTNFNRTAAAHLLGLSLRQIRYRIERLQIETPNPSDAIDDPI